MDLLWLQFSGGTNVLSAFLNDPAFLLDPLVLPFGFATWRRAVSVKNPCSSGVLEKGGLVSLTSK